MLRKIITSIIFLLWISVAKGELFDIVNKNDSEFCNICYCSIYKTIADCSRRGLTELPNTTQNTMYNTVQKLNLSNNEISLFPKYLKKFHNLVTLDLSSNQMSEIPEYALNNLTNLEVLDFSKNTIELWTKMHPNYVLRAARNLKVLNLSHNKFKTLSDDLELLESASLETLNLNNCEIEAINGESSLNGLVNLHVLNLNSNPITKINNLNSKSLKILHISNCSLNQINGTEFTNLPALIYLTISHNNHLRLSTDKVISETVQYLDISHSNILQPSLEGFPNVRKAVLSHNMIKYLRSNQFMNNSNLEYLDLSFNNIRSMMTDTFRGLGVLKYLDLSWNKIEVIPDYNLLEMPSLTHLNLSRNYLLQVGHLKSLTITVLDLSYCGISTIRRDVLKGLPSLVDLDLSHNLITRVPDLISSETLMHLNLNRNGIRFINNFTFFLLPQLTSLSVIGNRFSTIWKRSYFQLNTNLEKLELSDNMWRCDCKDENMFDFYKFVTLEPCSLKPKEHPSNLICNNTFNTVGKIWLEACFFTWYLTKDDSNGSVFWLIIPMIIGIGQCIMCVNCIRNLRRRRLLASEELRERHVEEARNMLRQLRMLTQQQAQINAPDSPDLMPPPTYDEALNMSQPPPYSHCIIQTGIRKSR